MSPKRIALFVLIGLSLVGGVVLFIFRQQRLAGMLRAAAEGALIKHDLTTLKRTRATVAAADNASASRVMALNHLIAEKEAAAVAVPMRLKGATEEQIDAELRASGLLK